MLLVETDHAGIHAMLAAVEGKPGNCVKNGMDWCDQHGHRWAITMAGLDHYDAHEAQAEA